MTRLGESSGLYIISLRECLYNEISKIKTVQPKRARAGEKEIGEADAYY